MRVTRILVGAYMLMMLGGAACTSSLSEKKAISGIQDRDQVLISPLPQAVASDGDGVNLSKGIAIHQTYLVDHKVSLSQFISDMKRLDIGMEGSGIPLSITVADYKDAKHPEGYELQISPDNISITAPTEQGVYYALQSLAQYAFAYRDDADAPQQTIIDYPQYPWRGLMLDVVRHFIPKKKIMETIEAMAAAKLNILHLHLSDDQGFRVESMTYPKLHRSNPDGHYYTQADIRDIINHAARHFVRVVPEFDMPGHTSAILAAYPTLKSSSDKIDVQNAYGIFPHLLNPAKESTYEFIDGLVSEMGGRLFMDQMMHIGGNEALLQEWASSPEIMAFAKEKELTDVEQLRGYFNLRLESILAKHGKGMILKNEALRPEYTKNRTIIHVDNNLNDLSTALKGGYSTILSTGWNLDHKQSLAQLYAQQIPPKTTDLLANHQEDNWQLYEFLSTLHRQKVTGNLLIYGTAKTASSKAPKVRGILSVLNQSFAIENATYTEDVLRFTMTNILGEISAALQLKNESLQGQMQYGIPQIDLQGKQIGGSDMPDGLDIQQLLQERIPSEEELAMIKGGEAMLWTEWISEDNLHSRVWPEAIAVAERLWSSPTLANDTDDLYRRAEVFGDYLSATGIQHDQLLSTYVNEQTGSVSKVDLYTFLSQLNEVRYLKRFQYHPSHNIEQPLEGIADIVNSESYDAQKLYALVAQVMESGISENLKDQIQSITQKWSPVYRSIKPIFENHKDLSPLESLAISLSDLSKIANHIMDNGSLTNEEKMYYNRLKANAVREIDGVYLAPARSLISLIDLYLQSV